MTNINIEEAIVECVQFERELEEKLGYNRAGFLEITIDSEGTVFCSFYCTDDFQENLSYHMRKQHGTQKIAAPPRIDNMLNREQRELHVLLAQQGESVALAKELTSAAGRRFAETLLAERAKYAQLVDFTQCD